MTDPVFRHPNAIVESDSIGEGTKIWAFSHVLEKARIGKNCNIGEGCFIESGVVLGDNVVVKNNISLWDGVSVEDDVFLGPNVVLTNDPFPRAKVFHESPVRTLIKKGASIGANTTVLCGLIIGDYAMVGAGSVVTRDVPSFALVYGNPARFVSWICACTKKLSAGETMNCLCGRTFRKKDKYSIEQI